MGSKRAYFSGKSVGPQSCLIQISRVSFLRLSLNLNPEIHGEITHK